MKILFLLLFLTNCVFAQINGADFTTFRDANYSYSFRYLKSWLSIEPSNPITRFKVVSEGGNGMADASINAVPKPEAKGKDAEAYYKAIKDNPQGMVQALRKHIPTAKLVEHGETKISNFPAYYTVIDFTQSGGNVEIPLRMVQYTFGRDGYTFTLTMRSARDEWEATKPIFDYMAFTFVFSPTK